MPHPHQCLDGKEESITCWLSVSLELGVGSEYFWVLALGVFAASVGQRDLLTTWRLGFDLFGGNTQDTSLSLG